MSNYSFMQTGVGGVSQQEIVEEYTTLFYSFLEYAYNTAGVYVSHAERNAITATDLNLALKLECFQFYNRPEESFEEFRERINEFLSFQPEIVPVEELTPFTPSSCDCFVCDQINQVESYWNQWNPTERIEIALKGAIDQMPSSN